MPSLVSASRLCRLCTAYIVFIALVTLTLAALNARAAHPWILGEWLINYSGGLVRRGLLGAFLLGAHRLTHLPLIALASALQITLYAAFYASLLPLLRGLRWSLPLLALLLSPATLAFTVLDPPTSVRKEVLLFLALSLLVHLALSRRTPAWQLASVLAIAAPILILTHEALLAFLPYLFLPLLLASPRLRDAARLASLPILLSALAFAVAVTHAGSSREAEAVCASVDGHLDHRPVGLCSGAIAYLALTPAQARAETLRAIHFYNYRTRYPLPILLTCLPIAWLFRQRWRQTEHRRAATLLLVLTALAVLASLPLFVIARDWGRWTEIHATCLLLCFLLLERPASDDIQPLPLVADPASVGSASPLAFTPLSRISLLLYATCWTLPAVGIFPGRFGYIDLARYLHSYRSKPHLSPARLQGTPLTRSIRPLLASTEDATEPSFKPSLIDQSPALAFLPAPKRQERMRLLSEFDIQFQLPAPTAMVALLHLHPSLDPFLVEPDTLLVEHVDASSTTTLAPSLYLDSFGNRCARFAAPAGGLRLSGRNVIEIPAQPDPINTAALQATVEDLPPETLQFLLSSRYCQVDQMSGIAGDLFGFTSPGWARAVFIRDWVHDHVAFNYKAARPTKTALDVFTERVGVCRDFQHLAITLTRAMNIPARYVTGHLGDIRHHYSGAGDFSAWYEVFLDGRWWAMDARHNNPRFGRILMATGRDATDVALTTSFGIANLTNFYVESNEVDAANNKLPVPPNPAFSQHAPASITTA